MSKMPARSENRPARAVNSSGTDRRTADPRTLTKISKKSIRLSSRPGKLLIDAPDRRTQHVLQRPGKQDHEALDHDDHVSRDSRDPGPRDPVCRGAGRSEEHNSELQSLMRRSYDVCFL